MNHQYSLHLCFFFLTWVNFYIYSNFSIIWFKKKDNKIQEEGGRRSDGVGEIEREKEKENKFLGFCLSN